MSAQLQTWRVFGWNYPTLPPAFVIQNYSLCDHCHQPFLLDSSATNICSRLSCWFWRLQRCRIAATSSNIPIPGAPDLSDWWAEMKRREKKERDRIKKLGLLTSADRAVRLSRHRRRHAGAVKI